MKLPFLWYLVASFVIGPVSNGFAVDISPSSDLPDATVSGSIELNPGFYVATGVTTPVNGPGLTSVSQTSSDSSASASINILTSPSPGLFLTAATSSTGGAGFTNIGTITLTYSMEILGQTGTVPVQIDADGEQQIISEAPDNYTSTTTLYSGLTISGMGYGTSGALFEVNSSFTDYENQTTKNATTSASFSTSQVYGNLFETNTIYTVSVFVHIDPFEDYYSGNTDYSVYVDPQFIITGNDPSAYSLIFSPGIGNGPINGIPEPSTWAMMLLGFGGLGFAVHRRATSRGIAAPAATPVAVA